MIELSKLNVSGRVAYVSPGAFYHARIGRYRDMQLVARDEICEWLLLFFIDDYSFNNVIFGMFPAMFWCGL